ncbi:MAG: CBS domain-containing protein [Bacteroidales bacterium]|nr:CBS domain-containing protein [Bacteroidales bacterium]
MLARELISDVIPALKTSDTGINALNWMEVFRVSHLPIVNNEKFLGIVGDSDIYDLNMTEEAIGSHNLSLLNAFVYENQHVYDVIHIVLEHRLSIVPVLDQDDNYLGIISLFELVKAFSVLASLEQPGGIIVLEMKQIHYSLAEISQIVEANNARILSSYVSVSDTSTKIFVTLKINTKELSSILRTFERYDYTIRYSFEADEINESLARERYEAFLNYLSV